MYLVLITYADGTVERHEVFGRIRAYALYYSAKRDPNVVSVKMGGASV